MNVFQVVKKLAFHLKIDINFKGFYRKFFTIFCNNSNDSIFLNRFFIEKMI